MNNGLRNALVAILWASAASCGVEADDDDDDDTTEGPGDDDSTPTHEEGCVTIDGAQPGYASIAEAIAAAPDGAEVAVCPGTWNETLTLDRPVHLRGAAPDSTTVAGATNEVAVIVRGTGITVEDLAIASTRTAVQAEAGSQATFRSVVIDQPGQTGVSATGADITLDHVAISGAPYGGADFSVGSTATVTGCTFADNAGYGIHVGASGLTLTQTTIDDTGSIDTDDGPDGGDAVYIEGGTGTISLDGLSARGNVRVGILADTATLSLTNSLIEGSAYGVFAFSGGDSVISDNVFTALAYVGINLIEQNADILRNTVALSPETSEIGIAIGRDGLQARVNDNTVSGAGNIGLAVQLVLNGSDFYGFTGGTAEVTGNTVADSALNGFYVSSLDALDYQRNVARNITWSGALESGSYSTGFGHVIAGITAAPGAAHLVDNEAHACDVAGMFLVESLFDSHGFVATGNKLWGAIYQEAAGTETGSTWDANFIYGAQLQSSTVEFVGCTFQGTRPGEPPEYWGDKDTVLYSANALVVYSATARLDDCVVDANEGYGAYGYEADLTATGTSFTNNEYAGLQFGGFAADGFPGVFEGCSFAGNGSEHVSLYSTDAEFRDCTFEGPTGFAGVYGYGFNGVVDGASFTGSSYYHLYIVNSGSTETAFQVLGSDFSDWQSYAIGGSGFSGAIADSAFANGSTAVYADLSGMDDSRSLTLYNNDFSALSTGLLLYVTSFTGAGPAITVQENEFQGLAGNAVYAYASGGTLSVLDNVMNGMASDGLYAPGPSGSILLLEVRGNVVETGAGNGIRVSNAAVTIADNVSVAGNGGDGIRLDGWITGEVTGNTIADNLQYGIGCYAASVSLAACENTMAGNGLGDIGLQGGCAIDCLVAAP